MSIREVVSKKINEEIDVVEALAFKDGMGYDQVIKNLNKKFHEIVEFEEKCRKAPIELNQLIDFIDSSRGHFKLVYDLAKRIEDRYFKNKFIDQAGDFIVKADNYLEEFDKVHCRLCETYIQTEEKSLEQASS